MGPIRVRSNGRYFVDQDGMPFFWLGDTQWELFRAVPAVEAAAILESRNSQGFTVFQVMITGVGDGTVADVAGQSPWIANDPASPNEAYFQNVDAVVEMAQEQGMVLVLGVFPRHQVRQEVSANRVVNANLATKELTGQRGRSDFDEEGCMGCTAQQPGGGRVSAFDRPIRLDLRA